MSWPIQTVAFLSEKESNVGGKQLAQTERSVPVKSDLDRTRGAFQYLARTCFRNIPRDISTISLSHRRYFPRKSKGNPRSRYSANRCQLALDTLDGITLKIIQFVWFFVVVAGINGTDPRDWLTIQMNFTFHISPCSFSFLTIMSPLQFNRFNYVVRSCNWTSKILRAY